VWRRHYHLLWQCLHAATCAREQALAAHMRLCCRVAPLMGVPGQLKLHCSSAVAGALPGLLGRRSLRNSTMPVLLSKPPYLVYVTVVTAMKEFLGLLTMVPAAWVRPSSGDTDV
jgi:hypothetical protein